MLFLFLFFQTVLDMPYNSIRRYHLVIARHVPKLSEMERNEIELIGKNNSSSTIYVAMIKGAPEVVLKYCTYLQIDGKRLPIDPEIHQECQVNNQT